ncbi:molybdate ABC transporter substrate-binding protein [Pseudaeromonas sharmana]|uniref:Molybdate ABC transporter substrate-binding protein n=1 Tax=Pseudaeromonas sharmana TaxID=328412 RepID=A0ABV8CM98_9GAMM
MSIARRLALLLCFAVVSISSASAGTLTVAAAADMKFAMAEIAAAFNQCHPGDKVEVVFGSSGKSFTQIQQGAPYDMFFSADIKFPKELIAKGFAQPEPIPYAVGRLVLWSTDPKVKTMTMQDLLASDIKKIAIANPKHAPYGKRAEEALKASGVWDKMESKLVLGEDIVQTAQFVQTGNAQVGLLALSLAMSPKMSQLGFYQLLPDSLHEPLNQAFVITNHGKDNPLAKTFADYMQSPASRTTMVRYGFVLPGEQLAK